MTDDLRQKLRDYARKEIAIFDFESGSRNLEYKQRGELAGPVFVALQNVLTYLDTCEVVVAYDIRREIGKAFGD